MIFVLAVLCVCCVWLFTPLRSSRWTVCSTMTRATSTRPRSRCRCLPSSSTRCCSATLVFTCCRHDSRPSHADSDTRELTADQGLTYMPEPSAEKKDVEMTSTAAGAKRAREEEAPTAGAADADSKKAKAEGEHASAPAAAATVRTQLSAELDAPSSDGRCRSPPMPRPRPPRPRFPPLRTQRRRRPSTLPPSRFEHLIFSPPSVVPFCSWPYRVPVRWRARRRKKQHSASRSL